jgi:hypothetical protein
MPPTPYAVDRVAIMVGLLSFVVATIVAWAALSFN